MPNHALKTMKIVGKVCGTDRFLKWGYKSQLSLRGVGRILLGL